MTDMMNEGIPGPIPGGPWRWSSILAYTVDMYGGVGGQMMAQGGMTGMPDQGGSSGSVIPGADGGSSTPPNRDNELLNPNGLPVPSWTPHGSPNPNGVSNLYAESARLIAMVAAQAPHEVNTGMWGVTGTGWSGHYPVDPNRTIWFGPHQVADKHQTMPTKHPQGPRVDPYFEIAPSVDWTNDYNIMNSPYEYENWPFPDNQITPIGDVVTFPGNPANDNNPNGPGGSNTTPEQRELAAALARALSGPQDKFFGP